MDGLLLVGHGTRNPAGLAEFQALAGHMALQASGMLVEACYLELAEPDIATGVQRLLEKGVNRMLVAPVLLFAAGHAKRDIPRAVEAAVDRHKTAMVGGTAVQREVTVEHLGALECRAQILNLSVERYREALASRPVVAPADTLLIMVARGSSVPDAVAMSYRFTELRSRFTPVGQFKTCFAAVATPALDQTLAWAADTGFRRIVVQPHLLFTGDVLKQIESAVGNIAPRRPDQEWIVTPHLGPSPLVAAAIVEMARGVMITAT